MKKILFVLVSLVMSVSMFGQGYWTKTKFEADEMTNTSEYNALIYSDNIGTFVYWDINNKSFKFASNNFETFNTETHFPEYGEIYEDIYVQVGLYDKNNKFIEKFKIKLRSDGNDFLETYDSSAYTEEYEKIITHLNSNEGYVRFIVDLSFKTADWDFKIPCKKITQTNKTTKRTKKH